MNTIKVIVGNHLMGGVEEEFLCRNVDISDLNEMEYCAEECVGAFIDMYHLFFDQDQGTHTYDQKVNSCWYTIEEVNANV